MKKKIIFLDIDGTLTEPGKNTPPDSALTAIRGAQKNGHFVFLCTGRNMKMLEPLLCYGFDGIVGSCGGYITVGSKVIYDCPMPDEMRDHAMEVLQKYHIYRTLECLNSAYVDEGLKEELRANQGTPGNSELLRMREQIEKNLSIYPMAGYKGEPVYKIVIMMTGESEIEKAKEKLKDSFQIVIQDRLPNGMTNGEVMNRKFDKGTGIRKVCEYLNIPIENSIGIGDSMNDREMLETVGVSICMENGSSRMKALSDEICPSVTEDGIYKAFLKHGLVNKETGEKGC